MSLPALQGGLDCSTHQDEASSLSLRPGRLTPPPPCPGPPAGATESQSGQGWKGPLSVIQSNPPAEAGSPTAGCTGPHPDGS